jgi:hypothetical protein
MNEEKFNGLEGSIRALEKKNRILTWFIVVLAAMGAAVLLGQTAFKPRDPMAPGQDRILRVRGISVVDEKGTERVYIGAPVPEPLILGKRFPRGGRMSGIILFDEDGTERSGYCTSDGYPNVLFTLDSIGHQHALFMAEPQGDTAFWIWNSANSFKLNVGEMESSLKFSHGGVTLFEAPAQNAASKGESR